jgi:ArsR family transcriptional regulator, cadmium/lead-responsive transcriptional repressor
MWPSRDLPGHSPGLWRLRPWGVCGRRRRPSGVLPRVVCFDSHMSMAAAPFELPEAPTQAELVAKYFRALGNPTRLGILELVQDQERSVSELVELLGVSQPKVSKHLACLRWCGFVASRREHRTVYYRLADDRVAAVLALGRALLADNAEHVAACGTIDGAC